MKIENIVITTHQDTSIFKVSGSKLWLSQIFTLNNTGKNVFGSQIVHMYRQCYEPRDESMNKNKGYT